MVSIDLASVSVDLAPSTGQPDIDVSGPRWVRFVSPPKRRRDPPDPVAATGRADLVGDIGDPIVGWRLGWIQLQFIETNEARYRGRSESEGSALVSRSHAPSDVCRDNDTRLLGRPDIPQNRRSPYNAHPDPTLRGPASGVGTFTVDGAGRLGPPARPTRRHTGWFQMTSGFGDAPSENVPTKIRKPGARVDYFLHHADIAFHFCALLVVERPGTPPNPNGSWDIRDYTVLKHFYWNIRWEAHFAPNNAGHLTIVRGSKRCELNVQRPVHSQMPRDPRFSGKLLKDLPISNIVADKPATIRFSAGWDDRWTQTIVAPIESLSPR